MKFNFETNEPNGLVLIDKYFFSEFNEELLYSFDIYLDVKGETELIYDFDEEWNVVRERESKPIRDLVDSGKLIVILSDKNNENCEIVINKNKKTSDNKIIVPSGKLLLINASELIQGLLYPEEEMYEIIDVDKITELDIEKGIYSIEYSDMKKISLSYDGPY